MLARLPGLDLGVSVPERVVPLVATLKKDSPRVDLKAVVRAYEVADAAHAGQKRKSGEPYIIHPIGVADLLAELGMDTATIVAALLHDVVEDTAMSVDDIARSSARKPQRWSTASRSWTASESRRRRSSRPRACARCSSRWRPTRGCC